jgi:hypothetical protein
MLHNETLSYGFDMQNAGTGSNIYMFLLGLILPGPSSRDIGNQDGCISKDRRTLGRTRQLGSLADVRATMSSIRQSISQQVIHSFQYDDAIRAAETEIEA